MQSNQSNRSQGVQTASELAKNLFGHGAPTEAKEVPDVLSPSYAVRAVYPTVTQDAFPMSMDNFRKYIAAYNAQIIKENIEIVNYNQEVALHIAGSDLDEIQKAYAERFPELKANKKLNIREYNEAVEALNSTYGLIVAKRPIPSVKPAAEQFFQNFLHIYNTQMIKRNVEYRRYPVRSKRPVQPAEINARLITKLMRNGVLSLPVCSKTVRNHRARLEEAGVLVGSTFHGRQKAVTAYVNPQILVIFDTKTEKYIGSENQTFILPNRKNLPDINEFTRAYKEEYKEKDDATQSSGYSEQAAPASFVRYKSIFYENTGSNQQNSPVGAAPENVKVEKTLNDKMRELLVHPQELAINLASHEYDNYTPIDIRAMQQLVYGGNFSNAEFKELAIQDLLKQSAKMWRNASPYTGNWKKAINRWMSEMFLSHTKDPDGNYHPLGKEAILKRLPELRWRLETARKWFVSKNTKPLFPYDYFDPTRKTAKERGFEYTKKAWARHLKYLETIPAVKLKEKQNAEKRAGQINHSKKFDAAISKFLKNRITLPQLVEYVEKNLPKSYYEDLPTEVAKRLSTDVKI